MAADGRPYSNGRWIFNDKVGWYFDSPEDWAEITYHYGRWYKDPTEGWVWIAGDEWAPAWVEWRRSKKFVGWRLLGVAIWVVSPILPVAAQMFAWAALLIVGAVYLHALDPLPPDASGYARLWKGVLGESRRPVLVVRSARARGPAPTA